MGSVFQMFKRRQIEQIVNISKGDIFLERVVAQTNAYVLEKTFHRFLSRDGYRWEGKILRCIWEANLLVGKSPYNEVVPPCCKHLLWEFFHRKVLLYNIRINCLLQLPKTRTDKYRNESCCFRYSTDLSKSSGKGEGRLYKLKTIQTKTADMNLVALSIEELVSEYFCSTHWRGN